MSKGHQNTNGRPCALTMGDPAGIGPELIVMAWSQLRQPALVIGRAGYLQRAANWLNSPVEVTTIESVECLSSVPEGMIPCLEIGDASLDDASPGVLDRVGGEVAFHAVVRGAQLALAGQVDSVVTLPLNKAAMQMAGHDYPGHTELLAELCGVDDFAMMLYIPPHERVGSAMGLGVVHTTLHESLRTAIERLTIDRVYRICHLANQFGVSALRALAVDRLPRLAVAALNPHAGEQGLFGNEEIEIIAPAVQRAFADGLDVCGPLPCDTLMPRAVAGEFDLVVAMYHDQGHIALKLLGMHRAVNITLGLPIIRTSVAHGTAFELAGRGQAHPQSLITAAEMAHRMVNANPAVETLASRDDIQTPSASR